jgi:DNA-binding transcriptional MerR regulator
MERTRHSLLSIGSFATATQLSLKALRLYDQLGILKPTYIDPDSSYRYYHSDQLRAATLIRMMRQMNMPLAMIRRVLEASPAEAEVIVTDYRLSVEAHVAHVRRAARDLLAYLHKEEPAMAWEVEVRNAPPQRVVSITRHVKIDQLEDHIVGSTRTLNELVEAQGGEVDGLPFGIYHGPVNENDNGPMEMCLPVRGAVAVSGEVTSKDLPATRLAYVDIEGDECEFPAILKAYDAVYDWIGQNGYHTDGPPWEIGTGSNTGRMQIAFPFRE